VITTTASDAPTTETEESIGPDATTEGCTRDQITMLNNHQRDARRWVNDATRKVTDYAYVFASSRHSAVPASAAEAAIVRNALNDNFHSTAAGHVLQIRDGFQELRSALATSFTYGCGDPDCRPDWAAFTHGHWAWVRRLGNVEICPLWFRCTNYFTRVTTLIHERAHQYPGATDHSYEFQGGYATMPPEDAIDNAESFAVAARQIYHGGARGPGAGGTC
jgi:hypothetical protein